MRQSGLVFQGTCFFSVVDTEVLCRPSGRMESLQKTATLKGVTSWMGGAGILLQREPEPGVKQAYLESSGYQGKL